MAERRFSMATAADPKSMARRNVHKPITNIMGLLASGMASGPRLYRIGGGEGSSGEASRRSFRPGQGLELRRWQGGRVKRPGAVPALLAHDMASGPIGSCGISDEMWSAWCEGAVRLPCERARLLPAHSREEPASQGQSSRAQQVNTTHAG
jgi:hypothetical protein